MTKPVKAVASRIEDQNLVVGRIHDSIKIIDSKTLTHVKSSEQVIKERIEEDTWILEGGCSNSQLSWCTVV